MLHGGVYAAIGEQAVQVEAAALGETVVHGLVIGGILEKFAGFDGAADAGQILKDDAAAADVGMPHFAVAHLPGGQTHVQPRGGEGGMGILGKEPIQHRGIGQRHGVAGAGGAHAEAVHDNEYSGCFIHNDLTSLFAAAQS